MLTVGLLRRIDALRLGAVLLILWVCGPCGPLLDRYFAERFPDHGHLYPLGYHLHSFQLAYTWLLSDAHRLALGPDGAVMAELKAAGAPTLGLIRILTAPSLLLSEPSLSLRVWLGFSSAPEEAAVFLPDPPPRPGFPGA